MVGVSSNSNRDRNLGAEQTPNHVQRVAQYGVMILVVQLAAGALYLAIRFFILGIRHQAEAKNWVGGGEQRLARIVAAF
jgi:hypothetical protein